MHPLEEAPREPHATARVFRFADGEGEIGFINPVSEPFCADCNRIRLTADGKLRTCLFSINETDLREPLRGGASDDGAGARSSARRLAQGAQAPRRRAGLPPAAADDVRDRWLSRGYTRHRATGGEGAQAHATSRSPTALEDVARIAARAGREGRRRARRPAAR